MKLSNWVTNGIQKLTWSDVSLIKASTFFFTLFLITVWSTFKNFVFGIDWYWYLILGIIAAIVPMKKFFK